MGDEDRGNVQLALHPFQFEAHRLSQFEVEVGEGFVEQQDIGFVDHGSGKSDPLLLASGQLVGISFLKAGQPDEFK